VSVEADVVAYLAAAGLGLTSGTNLFEGEMPELPAACVAVTHYASEASDDYVMSSSLGAPGYEIERFQVMTRHATRATAISTAASIHAVLDNLGTTTNFGSSGRTYFRIESDGPPFSIGQDPTLRWRRVANYRAQKARG
jgi:hypothetical protein